jgi:hypothetical protein
MEFRIPIQFVLDSLPASLSIDFGTMQLIDRDLNRVKNRLKRRWNRIFTVKLYSDDYPYTSVRNVVFATLSAISFAHSIADPSEILFVSPRALFYSWEQRRTVWPTCLVGKHHHTCFGDADFWKDCTSQHLSLSFSVLLRVPVLCTKTFSWVYAGWMCCLLRHVDRHVDRRTGTTMWKGSLSIRTKLRTCLNCRIRAVAFQPTVWLLDRQSELVQHFF